MEKTTRRKVLKIGLAGIVIAAMPFSYGCGSRIERDNRLNVMRQCGKSATYSSHMNTAFFLVGEDKEKIILFEGYDLKKGNHVGGYLPKDIKSGIYELHGIGKFGRERVFVKYEIENQDGCLRVRRVRGK